MPHSIARDTPRWRTAANAEYAAAIVQLSFGLGHARAIGDTGGQITPSRYDCSSTTRFDVGKIPAFSSSDLEGGPAFKFNEAVSSEVECGTQDDIDFYWTRLSAGGDPKAQQCGWLKDKFGLSWQIVPEGMAELFSDEDPEAAGRTMEALLPMKKLDIAELKRAHAGETSGARA